MSQSQVAAKPIAAKPIAAAPAAPSESLLDDLKRTFSRDNDQFYAGLAITVLIGILILAYLNSLSIAAAYWETSQYSFGWMVPLFSIAVIWMWWEPIKNVSVRDRWLGVAVITAALVIRVIVSRYAFKTPDMLTFVIAVAGVFLLVGGWPTLRWAAGPIAFLVFMLPLPMKVYSFLFLRLQTINTIGSVWILQTLGISAFADGNQINMDQVQLQVAEACSGMGMGTMLPAMCVAFVMVVPMQWWKRVIIIVSSLPIAWITNLVRIVGTSLLMKLNSHVQWIDPSNHQATDFWFHRVFGYIVMLPVAFGLLYLLWVILNHLFITVEESRPAPVAMRPPRVRVAVPK
jgi:exosortase